MDVEPRLRAFAAVARRGSFSRAAEELYVSQPAVSKHMAALEAEVRSPLVDRRRGGAVLTPAGPLLADYVLRAQALLANATRALAAGGDADVGTLALAASGIPGDFVLPAIVARFHDQHPRVEDEIVLVGPPALAGRRLRPRALDRLTWVSREEGSSTRAAVEAA